MVRSRPPHCFHFVEPGFLCQPRQYVSRGQRLAVEQNDLERPRPFVPYQVRLEVQLGQRRIPHQEACKRLRRKRSSMFARHLLRSLSRCGELSGKALYAGARSWPKLRYSLGVYYWLDITVPTPRLHAATPQVHQGFMQQLRKASCSNSASSSAVGVQKK